MSWLWLLPVPILLLGLVAAALLTRTVARERDGLHRAQADWAALGGQLADLRRRSDALGERRQELMRR